MKIKNNSKLIQRYCPRCKYLQTHILKEIYFGKVEIMPVYICSVCNLKDLLHNVWCEEEFS